jgi:hypothetical protein
MGSGVRNKLLALGALWGLLLAIFPAVLAFDRFALSPFLISALICAGFSGAVSMLFTGLRAAATPARRGLFAAVRIGVLQGLISAVLAALTIWLALTITISGFSVESPSEILDLYRQPAIFIEGAIAAIAVLVYTVAVGTLFSPVIGATIQRIVRPESAARRIASEPL